MTESKAGDRLAARVIYKRYLMSVYSPQQAQERYQEYVKNQRFWANWEASIPELDSELWGYSPMSSI